MQASLYLAAMAVGAFFGAGVGAWASTAVGRPILHVGLAIMAGGSALLYLSLRVADGGVGFGSLAPGLFVFGLGMGMIFVPLFSIIMGEIDDHEVGSPPACWSRSSSSAPLWASQRSAPSSSMEWRSRTAARRLRWPPDGTWSRPSTRCSR